MKSALIASFLDSLATGLDGLLVALFPRVSRNVYNNWFAHSARSRSGFALALAAGAMIFVASDQLIPESRQRPEAKAPSLGLIAGFLLVAALTKLFA